MSKVVRGFFLFSIASFIAVVVGYIVHIALGRALGPGGYGVFNTVNSLITITSVITTAGIPLAVAKFVSEREGSSRDILKKGLILQFILAVFIFLVYMLGAELIAGSVGDPSLAFFIRIAALGVPLGAMFGLLDSYFNGRKSFGRQTVDSIISNVMKLSAIIFVFLGFGVAGALGGYVLSPLLGLVAASIFCWMLVKGEKKDTKESNVGFKKLLYFAIPTIAFTLCLTLLYNIDIISVKSLLKSDELSGFYSAASMISRISLFLLGAITVVLFPTLSGSISLGEIKTTRKYISNTFRYLLILLLPIALIVGITSGDFVSLIYSSKFLPAASPLSILFFGFVCIVFLQLFGMIINAEGKPWIIAAILAIAVIISIILNLILDPLLGITGAAIATTFAALVGALIAGFYVNKRHGIEIRAETIARIVAGLILIVLVWFVLSKLIVLKGIFLLVEYAILFGGYLVFLLLIKEFGKEDWEALYKILPGQISIPLRKILGN